MEGMTEAERRLGTDDEPGRATEPLGRGDKVSYDAVSVRQLLGRFGEEVNALRQIGVEQERKFKAIAEIEADMKKVGISGITLQLSRPTMAALREWKGPR